MNENINSVNPLYLIIGKANGYVEENNGNNYLVLLLQMVIIEIYKTLG